jgi:hypothetical protein
MCIYHFYSDNGLTSAGMKRHFHSCVTLQTRYGLDIRFIDHLYTPLGTTPTDQRLATASTEGDFLAYRTQVFLSRPPV